MKIFKIEGGGVFVNHHGRLLFPLPNPTDKDDPQPQEGHAFGGKGGAGSSRAQAMPPK